MSGWEPATVTTFEYDAAGNVTRSVTVSEPEFSPDDVALLLTSRRLERIPRGKHGIPMVDAMNPDNQFKFGVEVGDDYAERALLHRQEQWRKANPGADTAAKLWLVTLKD